MQFRTAVSPVFKILLKKQNRAPLGRNAIETNISAVATQACPGLIMHLEIAKMINLFKIKVFEDGHYEKESTERLLSLRF